MAGMPLILRHGWVLCSEAAGEMVGFWEGMFVSWMLLLGGGNGGC